MGHPPQIPLTPMTDERNFPRHVPNAPLGHSGSQFPKMLTRKFTSEDRTEWREKNLQTDQVTGKQFYNERCPKVGDPVPLLSTDELVDAGFAERAGEPIIVQSSEDEELVYDTLGIKAPIEQASATAIPIAPSQHERDLEAENRELRAKLAAKPKTKRRKKRRAQRVEAEAEADED